MGPSTCRCSRQQVRATADVDVYTGTDALWVVTSIRATHLLRRDATRCAATLARRAAHATGSDHIAGQPEGASTPLAKRSWFTVPPPAVVDEASDVAFPGGIA